MLAVFKIIHNKSKLINPVPYEIYLLTFTGCFNLK